MESHQIFILPLKETLMDQCFMINLNIVASLGMSVISAKVGVVKVLPPPAAEVREGHLTGSRGPPGLGDQTCCSIGILHTEIEQTPELE